MKQVEGQLSLVRFFFGKEMNGISLYHGRFKLISSRGGKVKALGVLSCWSSGVFNAGGTVVKSL